MRSISKRSLVSWSLTTASLAAIGGGLVLAKSAQVREAQVRPAMFGEPTESVELVRAKAVKIASAATAVGTLEAQALVDIRIEVSGPVSEIGFSSGDHVEKGQLLLQIDTAEERAHLEAARVNMIRTRNEAKREHELLAIDATSSSMVEQADAAAAAAAAALKAIKTQIRRKTIVAPFSGTVGITDVKPGQYVSAGDTIVRLIGDQKSAYVDFALPQREAAQTELGQTITVGADGKTAEATIIASEPLIDPTTRTRAFRALADLSASSLVPGSFVTVRVETAEAVESIIVPSTSVVRGPYGATVYVVEKDGDKLRARSRQIELGPNVDRRYVIVTAGLEAGATLAADGSYKLREGALVSSAGTSPVHTDDADASVREVSDETGAFQ